MVAQCSKLLKLYLRFVFIICDNSTNAVFMLSCTDDALGSSAGKLYLMVGLLALSGMAMGEPMLSSSCLRVCGSSDEDVSWQWFAMKFNRNFSHRDMRSSFKRSIFFCNFSEDCLSIADVSAKNFARNSDWSLCMSAMMALIPTNNSVVMMTFGCNWASLGAGMVS
jgi:hypothetical protein